MSSGTRSRQRPGGRTNGAGTIRGRISSSIDIITDIPKFKSALACVAVKRLEFRVGSDYS